MICHTNCWRCLRYLVSYTHAALYGLLLKCKAHNALITETQKPAIVITSTTHSFNVQIFHCHIVSYLIVSYRERGQQTGKGIKAFILVACPFGNTDNEVVPRYLMKKKTIERIFVCILTMIFVNLVQSDVSVYCKG